jgi:hypothetical protein
MENRHIIFHQIERTQHILRRLSLSLNLRIDRTERGYKFIRLVEPEIGGRDRRGKRGEMQ